MKISGYDSAVVPVIGVVLLVLMTILMASGVLYSTSLKEPEPLQVYIDAKGVITPASVGSESFAIESSSGIGGHISREGTIYALEGGSETFEIIPDDGNKIIDVLIDGETVGAITSYEFRNISSAHTIYANFGVGFDIEDKEVIPKGEFTGSATVIGAAITNGAGGDPIEVTARILIGGNSTDPWGSYDNPMSGNVNDGNNPRTWRFQETYQGDTPVTVKACSWRKYGSSRSKLLEVSSSGNSPNMKVLKNGDSVPPIQGFADQASMEEFVSSYIEDGKMKLGENEAIYFFELGTTDLSSSGADFQDLVVLVSLEFANETEETNVQQYSPILIPKIVIEHLGGDTLNFSSPYVEVMLETDSGTYRIDAEGLGLLYVGCQKSLALKEYETNNWIDIKPRDKCDLKIVDTRSKTVIINKEIEF
ncbi:hypothetical protein ACSAZL_09060 [Methanosarcina sp. T3]|uniref:hypothetical protein n=1 Tax=Methanosarcina sp. T3 TaxID=3439062 RepID=UPI003F878AC1